MITGRDIVNQALWKAGITGRGITPSGTDTSDALADLNDMLGQWRTQSFMTWDKLNTGFIGDGRTTPYSVGPGGEFNMTPRPNRIYSAFLRQLGNAGNLPVDTPLGVIEAREDYNMIATKSLVSFPSRVFLDTALPLAQLYCYPWPSPGGQYQVFITTRGSMPVITLGTDMTTFPDGYVPCMKFNLARRLRQAYGRGMKPDPELNRMANDALDVVMQANVQLAQVNLPIAVLQRGAPGYNIYSDQ